MRTLIASVDTAQQSNSGLRYRECNSSGNNNRNGSGSLVVDAYWRRRVTPICIPRTQYTAGDAITRLIRDEFYRSAVAIWAFSC